MNKEKHIKDVFKSDRSRLLSGVVEKSYFPTKDVSKSWAACSMPSTEKETADSPCSCHQTCSIMCYDPSNSFQMAIPAQSLKQAHSHHAKIAQLSENV